MAGLGTPYMLHKKRVKAAFIPIAAEDRPYNKTK
jgi:hypothetical protein